MNSMNWFEILKAVLAIIPDIIKMIRVIEEAIPESGKGEDKLSIIKTTILAVSDEAAGLWPTLEKIIAGIVGIFNLTGTFKKG